MPEQRRQPLGRRINAWLAEAPGETFRDGKWRFWLIAVIGLSVLNSILTALVFQNDDQENYMAAIVLSAGALVAWICVGAIHYSDNDDRKLSVGVSALDSVALVFVAAHFCGLLWVYGHMRTLRGADARYEAAAAKFNAEARQVQDGNVKIAEAAQAIAQENTKAERLRNDTAYQQRRTIEAGGIIPSSRRTTQSATLAPALSTSAVELERPVKPDESAPAFLSRWDAAIRLAQFGELLLAVLTLVFIRNRTAQVNAPTAPVTLPVYLGVTARTPAVAAPLRQPQTQTHVSSPAPVSSSQNQTRTQTHVSSTFNREGLRLLSEK